MQNARNPSLLLRAYVSHLQDGRRMASGTVEGYGHDVRQLLDFLEADTPADLASLRPATIRAWLAERRSEGLNAATSRSRALSALKSFLRWLQQTQGIENAAILAMSGPKKPERLPRPTSEDDTKQLISVAETIAEEPWVQARDVAILTLLYAAGLRISEALSLTGADTPLPDVLRIKGKREKVRLIPVIPVAKEAVDAYVRLCPFTMTDASPLFYGVRGGPLSPRIVQRLMEQLRGILGLPDSATPHALRHAFASHLLSNGGDLRSIQGLMGHASPSTTQVYLGLEDARLTNAHKQAHPRA